MGPINNFNDFYESLKACGFSAGGESGIFTLSSVFGPNIEWHTGDPETDPWEWRMRVLEEKDDIAYGKLFDKKSGFISQEWYPYFYAVRRRGLSFDEEYENGGMSVAAKRVYDVLRSGAPLAYHELKRLGGFGREEKSRFESAVTDLQMKMYITMRGRAQKLNRLGEGYGWSSTVFTTVESFWGEGNIPLEKPQAAYEKIEQHIFALSPAADPKRVRKFIRG